MTAPRPTTDEAGHATLQTARSLENALAHYYDELNVVLLASRTQTDPDSFSPGYELPELDDRLIKFFAPSRLVWQTLPEESGRRFFLLDLRGNAATRTTKTMASLLMVARAVAQSLVPTVIKSRFPDRVALVTGLYTFSINVGAVLATGATVPLRNSFGGSWPAALAFWSVLVVPAMGLWYFVLRGADRDATSRGNGTRDASETTRALPWASGRAWLVAVFFGGTSCLYWSTLTWLAPLYQDQGFAEQHAGFLLTAFAISQTVATLVIPALADRSKDRRPWLALCLTMTVSSFVAISFAPLAAPWVWAVTLGAGIGALVPLALTLPLDNASDAAAAGRLSAMTFFVGYLMAAIAPLAVGALRGVTGSPALPMLALAALGLVMLAASRKFRPTMPNSRL